MNDKMPIVTLKSGLRVGNFSSPHEFRFVTGEVLPACSPERAKALMLDSSELEEPNEGGWVDIKLKFTMSDVVRDAIDAIDLRGVDVVLVPLPVRRAMDDAADHSGPGWAPTLFSAYGACRVCRVADRVTKTIYGDKFCL